MKSTPVFEKLPFEVELICHLTQALQDYYKDSEGYCPSCLSYGSFKHSPECSLGNLLKLATEYVNDNSHGFYNLGMEPKNNPMDLA